MKNIMLKLLNRNSFYVKLRALVTFTNNDGIIIQKLITTGKVTIGFDGKHFESEAIVHAKDALNSDIRRLLEQNNLEVNFDDIEDLRAQGVHVVCF